MPEVTAWGHIRALLVNGDYFLRSGLWDPLFFAALTVEGIALAVTTERIVRRNVEVAGSTIRMAVISHAGGQGLMTFALAHLPTSFSSMTGLLQTAVAAVVAWILFAEPLTPMMLASGTAILAGIWICRRAMAG